MLMCTMYYCILMCNKNEQFVFEIICIYMFLNNRNTMNTYLLYSYLYNCIQLVSNWQLIKSIPRILIFVQYLYFIFMPYITNITVQHEGCTLLIPTDFDFLTNYSSMNLSSFCKWKGMYIPLT